MSDFLEIEIDKKNHVIKYGDIGMEKADVRKVNPYDDFNEHPYLNDGTWSPLRECAGSGGCIISKNDGKEYSVDFYLSYDEEPHYKGQKHWNFEVYLIEIRKGTANKTICKIPLPSDIEHLPDKDTIPLKISYEGRWALEKTVSKN